MMSRFRVRDLPFVICQGCLGDAERSLPERSLPRRGGVRLRQPFLTKCLFNRDCREQIQSGELLVGFGSAFPNETD